jgi:hypothetical protein
MHSHHQHWTGESGQLHASAASSRGRAHSAATLQRAGLSSSDNRITNSVVWSSVEISVDID